MLKKRRSIEFHAFELSLGDSVSHVAPNLTELQRWSSALACTKTFITSRFYTTYNHAPIVPCLHAHVQLAVPGLRLLVKCLWAALCGFLSLKGPVLLNVDCHDVSSKPQPCLLCVTVTIYFRPLREKQLSFHQCSSLTRTLGLNTVLLLPGQNRHPNGGARPFSQSLGWSKTIKRVGKKMRIDQLKRMPHV